MDPFAPTDLPPGSSVRRHGVRQPRVPSEWDTPAATVDEIDGQGLIAHSHVLNLWVLDGAY